MGSLYQSFFRKKYYILLKMKLSQNHYLELEFTPYLVLNLS